MTIVINFGDILYWVAVIFGGFFGLYAAGSIIGASVKAVIKDLSQPIQWNHDFPLDRMLRRVHDYIKHRWGQP